MLSLSQVERAILEGLGWRESDLTRSAREQLSRIVGELGAVEALELGPLARSRELWSRLGETRPLDLRLLPYVYPALATEWRAVSRREEHAAKEERELWASLGHTPSWLKETSD